MTNFEELPIGLKVKILNSDEEIIIGLIGTIVEPLNAMATRGIKFDKELKGYKSNIINLTEGDILTPA